MRERERERNSEIANEREREKTIKMKTKFGPTFYVFYISRVKCTVRQVLLPYAYVMISW